MAEAHESMTEVEDGAQGDAEEQVEHPKRRRFGRRRKAPDEVRSETEWVDTLHAHEDEAGPPDVPEENPFAAGDDTEAEAPELPPLPEAEEEAAEASDDDPWATGSPGDMETHRDWRRRQPEDVTDIREFIDHILGTELDPARRRQRMERVGSTGYRPRDEVSSVAVEGLEQDLLIAFTFPRSEFRGARVIYETEGGYVVEVSRAIGGDDDAVQTQYYSVSRVGEVAHVLDKLRARELAREMEASGAPAPAELASEHTEPVPDVPPESDPGPEPEAFRPPVPSEPAPEAEPTAEPEPGPPADSPETPADPEPAEPTDEAPNEADDDAASGGRLKGMFKRKKGAKDDATGDDPGSAPTDTPGDAEAGDAEEPGDTGAPGGRLKGLFKRKKGADDAESDEAAEADATAADAPADDTAGESDAKA